MTPEISCVIPAFESPAMLSRCLASVIAQEGVGVEIIVTDDSPTPDATRQVVERLSGPVAAAYRSGPRSGNPVENWNAGLDAARGDIKLLIHHDEWLVDRRYLRRAVDAVSRPGVVAAIGGVRVTGLDRPSRFGVVSPILRALPGAECLLPALNWIGPTAAFVFRGAHRFDPSLVQLADVEFYGRVLRAGRAERLTGTAVDSVGHHGAQISAGFDTVATARREMALLAARSPPGIGPMSLAVSRLALRLRYRGGTQRSPG